MKDVVLLAGSLYLLRQDVVRLTYQLENEKVPAN
jgi:hypothetical protein